MDTLASFSRFTSRLSETHMHAHTHAQHSRQSQKTNSKPRMSHTSIDVSLFVKRETFTRSVGKGNRNMLRLCVALFLMSVWFLFFLTGSISSKHILSFYATRFGSRAYGCVEAMYLQGTCTPPAINQKPIKCPLLSSQGV